ncbi:MAG TPA: alpha-amylase/4-alpha-glucanotransferase domain-containing protein [Nitrospirota bacterium]|nr:alpha-amylase/4-alpha-glucanotransferase domain-containing protein [Nitrospirota bacterium]
MPKVQFIFAIHNHQPVGNFDFVAEEAYQKAYLPFLKALEQHRSIKITLHYTGILYHYFEKHHPEFIDMLKKLAAEGRVEVLSGGFYEPILAVLPDDDKIGQVRALSDYIRHTLGHEAKGMWLAERVWEPHLPKSIAAAGIGHVVVDDFHFKMAGLRDDDLDGYYLTEEQDGVVRIFPGSEKLRYLIPFHPPEETIAFLSGLRSTERNRLAVMADDGEKFGVWPETYHTVYEEGWLERFFTLIEQNTEWLEPTTFSEYIAKEPARGRIYLPTASYMEMGEWSLPTRAMKEYDDALATVKNSPEFASLRPFVKGGFWRNFFAKYSESNHMHKRMMMVSGKVHDVLNGLDTRGPRMNAETGRMIDHLYQSQCNDSYWHGVFGGLYLPHLRSAVYEQLIRAEYLADKMSQGASGNGEGKHGKNIPVSWLEVERGDFDRDGNDEVMINSELLNLFVDPAEGGRLTELDWKPGSFNLTNTLTRRKEGYHEKILQMVKDRSVGSQHGGAKTIHERVSVKEEGLQYHLLYDWYTRGSLLDHFLGSGVDLPSFMKSEYYEAGDFVLGAYRIKTKKSNGSATLLMEREGNVAGLSVRLRKDLSLRTGASEFVVKYSITNLSNDELNTSFGTEFNFSLLAGNSDDRYYDIPGHTLDKRNLASSGETNNVNRVDLVDDWLRLRLTLVFSQPAVLWRAPVETVSQSESGFERVYQSSLVMPIWRLSLGPGASWETAITVRIE